MALAETVNADITAAMKAKDGARLSALRMLKAAIMNKGVEKGRDLEDALTANSHDRPVWPPSNQRPPVYSLALTPRAASG